MEMPALNLSSRFLANPQRAV